MSAKSKVVERQPLPLADVAEIVSGYGFPKEMQGKVVGELPFFKVGDISAAWNSGLQKLTQAKHYLDGSEASAIKAKPFPQGTVVFAKIGEAIKLNRRAILGQPSIVDNNVMGLIPKEGMVDQNYLFYWSLMLRLGDISQATTVPSVRKSDVEQLSFPWVPLDQQKSIVAEIEKQFSRLDEAVANLKRVKANLKRYKAAVLKAAVEGKLTEAWRKQHPDTEPASELLQRILAERRVKWVQAEHAKMQAKGKTPKDDAWKKKYPEPMVPDTTDLPELPVGWVWVSAEQVCDLVASGSTPAPNAMFTETGEVPFIKVYNLTFGGALDFTIKPTYISRSTHEGLLARSRVLPGDVLMNIVGPPLGKVSVAPNTYAEWNINQAIVTFRPASAVNNRVLAHWLRSTPVLQRLEGTAKATAGQFNLQVTTCRKLAIPLPPLLEQIRIAAETDRCLTLTDEAEAQVNANLQRAVRLRQSILNRAFAGGMCVGEPSCGPLASEGGINVQA